MGKKNIRTSKHIHIEVRKFFSKLLLGATCCMEVKAEHWRNREGPSWGNRNVDMEEDGKNEMA